jgi:amidase
MPRRWRISLYVVVHTSLASVHQEKYTERRPRGERYGLTANAWQTNCLHEIFFPTALARAKELDAYYSTHGRTMGPLHGLPISLKDQFHVKGVDTTMGYVGWKGTNGGDTREGVLHQIESQMTKEFLALGAVLYVKTSVPQTLLLGESVNNLIGKTLNPHNSLLSCGGSSGGEGALIGMKGSSLGVGTDIGGSVRIPAAFSGIYSLKPTHDRMSYRDMANTSPGQTTYASSCGFMASSLDGIALGMEAILSTKPWLRDPEVVAIPWRKEVVQGVAKPLKLGIFWSDDAVTPHPPITRGLKMVVEAAKKAGHQIVEWTPPAHGPAAVLHVSCPHFSTKKHPPPFPLLSPYPLFTHSSSTSNYL